MGYRFDEPAGFGGADRRVSPRLRALTAGFVANCEGDLISDCLVRDVGTNGVQIRTNAEAAIPGNSYLVNLETRLLFQVQPVWRRRSLAGMAFDAIYIVGATLPTQAAFIPRLCVEARHRRMKRLMALGVDQEEARRACGLMDEPREQPRA